MGWLDFLFPVALSDAEIRVLAPPGPTMSVSVIVKTLTRTLSVVLSFDGRATNTDVRQPMRRVAELMLVDRSTHAPPVLSFEWRGQSLQCVMESAVEEFQSVFPDGRPSRGHMHVVFRESRTLEQLQQEVALQ